VSRNPTLQVIAERAKASADIAKVIGKTLSLKGNDRQLIALCPFHKERTPSFNVYGDHYHCFGCGAHGDVVDWLIKARRMTFAGAVQHLGNGASADLISPQQLSATRIPQDARRHTAANYFLRCWDQGVDPVGTIVETYLEHRGGLTIPKGAPIRFHHRCQRGARDLPGGPEFWPAMMALMTDPITGTPVGLHRTYLLPDGTAKAPATKRGGVSLKPKMILGTWGAVCLVPYAEIGRALAVAEGIENALTAMQSIGWGPTWAVGTQDCLRKFPVLPWIEAVTIFADADDTGVGLTAAQSCSDHWVAAGREATICFPPEGKDWNDAARRLPHDPI
jgi:putative DNA primase/helicase